MLLKITRYDDLDARKLMDVYAESNAENTRFFCPDEPDEQKAIGTVEAGFLDFLKNGFFGHSEAACWVLQEDGVWLSAARTCRIREGLYFLEALETRPDQRKKGYGSRLLSGIADALKKDGAFRLCDCVEKTNAASLKTHEACGFCIVSEAGYDYLLEEADDRDYGLAYEYIDEKRGTQPCD